jgi:hypothetical protein
MFPENFVVIATVKPADEPSTSAPFIVVGTGKLLQRHDPQRLSLVASIDCPAFPC